MHNFWALCPLGRGGVCGKYFPDTQAWTHEALIYAKFIKSSCRRGWMKGLHCCLPSRMCFSSHPLPKSKADFLNRHKFTHAHTNTHSQKWGGGGREIHHALAELSLFVRRCRSKNCSCKRKLSKLLWDLITNFLLQALFQGLQHLGGRGGLSWWSSSHHLKSMLGKISQQGC